MKKLALVLLGSAALAWAISVHESTQADFADGQEAHYIPALGDWAYGGLGQDLFAAHDDEDGAVKFIAQDWDFDDDGYIDLLCPDYTGGPLYILWGPSWTATNIGSVYPNHVAAGDLDGDWDLDFISANGFYVFRCNGSRTYTQVYSGGASTADAGNIGDLNGDGWLDALVGYWDPARIYWGSGDPGNWTYSNLNGTSYAMEFAVADFNRDGAVDVAVGQLYTDVLVFWGPNFSSSTTLDVPGGSQGLQVADLNGDGWLDIITGPGWGGSNTVSVFWGGQSGFTPGPSVSVGSQPGQRIAIADLNGDGNLDVVVNDASSGQNTVIYWGPNFFSSSQTIPQGGTEYGSRGIDIADINDDGYLDIICGMAEGSHGIKVAYGPGYSSYTTIYTGYSWYEDGLQRDLGDLYSRLNYVAYVSNVFDGGGDLGGLAVDWGVYQHPGLDTVRLFVRAGDTPTPDPSWTPWTEVTPSIRQPDGGTFKYAYSGSTTVGQGHRYLQYAALLQTNNYKTTPALRWVNIETALFAGEGPAKKPLVYAAGRILYARVERIEVFDAAGRSVYRGPGGKIRLPKSGVYLWKAGHLKGRVAVR